MHSTPWFSSARLCLRVCLIALTGYAHLEVLLAMAHDCSRQAQLLAVRCFRRSGRAVGAVLVGPLLKGGSRKAEETAAAGRALRMATNRAAAGCRDAAD